MTRDHSDQFDIPTTPELMDFLGRMGAAYGWDSAQEAARRLLDAACTFTESCQSERLTPDPSH